MLYGESSWYRATGGGSPTSASAGRVRVPYSIGAHLQAAVYALSEQAGVIISWEEAKTKSSEWQVI